MKLRSRIVFIGLIWTFVMGCNEVPEYSIVPSISLQSLSFYDYPGTFDSLTVEIRFQDGDGDLGLDRDPEDEIYNSDPFHPLNYFIANNNTLTPISTFNGTYSGATSQIKFKNVLIIDEGVNGLLATDKTRDDPNYSFMPENNYPASCTNYISQKVWLINEDVRIVNDTYDIDTLELEPGLTLYSVNAIFYTEPNINNTNITVDIYYKDGTDFKLFNWFTDVDPPNCGFPQDGRFPMVTETKEPTEGTIRYFIGSNGFKDLFGSKDLYLKIQIRDRAGNQSNIETSKIFTLNEIKK